MTKVEKLMRLTNAGILACMEAIQNTDSFEEAIEYVKPVSKKQLKRGMIVTFDNANYLPSTVIGTTTKVLHKTVIDENHPTWEDVFGNMKPLRITGVVFLENRTKFQTGMRYLNVPMIIEDPLCLRPATSEEKARYYSSKRTKPLFIDGKEYYEG
jgi:hypothetical protein